MIIVIVGGAIATSTWKFKKVEKGALPTMFIIFIINIVGREKKDKNKRITIRWRNKEKKKEKKKRSMVGGVQSSITIAWFLVIFLAS